MTIPLCDQAVLVIRAMEKLFAEGRIHLMSLLSSRATEKAMLVCGTSTGASGSSGCGKTSLAKLLCREAAESDHRAHVAMVQCKMLRGKILWGGWSFCLCKLLCLHVVS